MPNLERLKVFHLVYSHRSIQKTADLLRVTRSAVSQSLKALETELGTPLFQRNAKNFKPTREAERLFETVAPFIHDLQTTLQKIDIEHRIPSGHLRIGAPLDFGSDTLTKVIGRFRQKFPDVTFEIHLSTPIEQLERLCRGELDLAFIDNGDIHAERFAVTVRKVTSEEFVMVSSDEIYRSFSLKSAGYKNLLHAPVVDYLPHAPVTRMWFKHHFGKQPLNLNVAYSAESVRAVLTAIQAGIGIGVVPNRLLTGEFQKLKQITSTRSAFVNQIMSARALDRKANRRELEFLEFCRGPQGFAVS